MLAFAAVTYFHEEQRFRESWLWLAIASPIAFAIWILLATPGVPASTVVLVVAIETGGPPIQPPTIPAWQVC